MCMAGQRQLTVNSDWTTARPWSAHTEDLTDVLYHLLVLQSFTLERGGHFPVSPAASFLPSHSFHLGCLTTLPWSHLDFSQVVQNLVWTTGGFKLMNSFYWTWINLRIEISQLLLSDDLSTPEDVLSIKKTAPKETKCVQLLLKRIWREGQFCEPVDQDHLHLLMKVSVHKGKWIRVIPEIVVNYLVA